MPSARRIRRLLTLLFASLLALGMSPCDSASLPPAPPPPGQDLSCGVEPAIVPDFELVDQNTPSATY